MVVCLVRRVPRREAEKRLRKTHREFIDLYRLHDVAVDYFRRLASLNGCRVSDYGLEKRYSRRYYYYDERPDLLVECPWGRMLVEVKAKRACVVPQWTYVNVRHVKGYLEHSRRVDLPVYLFVAFVCEEEVVGYWWFDLNSIDWSEVPVKRVWDGNEVYVLWRKMASASPFLYQP